MYLRINEVEDPLPVLQGLHLKKIKKFKGSGPKINYDFSKHVLIELLDDSTSESRIWSELGLTNNKNVIHKRIMIDSHRVKCRRAIVVCVSSEEAKLLAERLSQTVIINRCVCAVVIQDLLSDLCLFEKQIIQFGDGRPQQQLLYVSDLNRCREPSGLVKFLKEKFSLFGTILSVLVCPDADGYAYPEGVIKFEYLSEAFAAELALDQYVIGKERLSVTTHHNILLSQCDLRVRLRDAQWCNNPEPYTFSESPYHSYEPNTLSTFDEDPVVNSIENLHISSENIECVNKESALNNVSISNPKDNQCQVNFHCEKDNLNENYEDSIVRNSEKFKSLSLSGNNKNINNLSDAETGVTEDSFHPNAHPNEDIDENNFSLMLPVDTALKTCTNSTNVLNSYQFEYEHKLNLKAPQDLRNNKDSKILSESASIENCDPNANAHSSYFSAKNGDYSATSKYPLSCKCKQMSIIHNDSEKRKLATSKSKKRRKHFTPSQKLSLKSQRIGFTQNTVKSTNAKSEISNSSPSSNSVKSSQVICRKNRNLCNATSKGLLSLPEVAISSKVTNWLAHLPLSQNISFISDTGQNFNTEVVPSVKSVSSMKKHNRISVHNRPSIKSKANENGINSDNNPVENETPDEKTVILSKEDFVVSQNDKFKSPVQAWLKLELVSATNNNVIKSQETTKSVIVCAAKTKDVIISVGCSHMTCEFCYPQSTDLLLGYS